MRVGDQGERGRRSDTGALSMLQLEILGADSTCITVEQRLFPGPTPLPLPRPHLAAAAACDVLPLLLLLLPVVRRRSAAAPCTAGPERAGTSELIGRPLRQRCLPLDSACV